jgi:translation initiation factor 1
MDICPKCGLPKEACVCTEIAKEEQKIKISVEKKRYGKLMTVISGFNKDIDLKDIAKKLKSEFACGGTVKDNTIELQGDHKKKIKQALIKLGFPEDSISE